MAGFNPPHPPNKMSQVRISHRKSRCSSPGQQLPRSEFLSIWRSSLCRPLDKSLGFGVGVGWKTSPKHTKDVYSKYRQWNQEKCNVSGYLMNTQTEIRPVWHSYTMLYPYFHLFSYWPSFQGCCSKAVINCPRYDLSHVAQRYLSGSSSRHPAYWSLLRAERLWTQHSNQLKMIQVVTSLDFRGCEVTFVWVKMLKVIILEVAKWFF